MKMNGNKAFRDNNFSNIDIHNVIIDLDPTPVTIIELKLARVMEKLEVYMDISW